MIVLLRYQRVFKNKFHHKILNRGLNMKFLNLPRVQHNYQKITHDVLWKYNKLCYDEFL